MLATYFMPDLYACMQAHAVYDPESAMLHGGAATFQPMAGMVRGRLGAFAVLPFALLLDKVTVALYNRPLYRLLYALYFVALHVALVAF